MKIGTRSKYIKISKLGISFPYYGDEITYLWKWRRSLPNNIFRSARLSLKTYRTLKDYDKDVLSSKDYIGKKYKVLGLNLKTILESWVNLTLYSGVYVILFDINVSRKDTSFWDRIPSSYKLELVKDVVILRCKDITEATYIFNSIESTFATAGIVEDGLLVDWNV